MDPQTILFIKNILLQEIPTRLLPDKETDKIDKKI